MLVSLRQFTKRCAVLSAINHQNTPELATWKFSQQASEERAKIMNKVKIKTLLSLHDPCR